MTHSIVLSASVSLSDLTSDVIGKPVINGNQLTCTTSARGDRDDDDDEEDDIAHTRTGGQFKATIYSFTYLILVVLMNGPNSHDI